MSAETDAEYVSRFVSVHGRLPEYCTRCEQWEGVCWHHPSPPAPESLDEAVGDLAAALKTTALYRLLDRMVAALVPLANRIFPPRSEQT